MSEQLSPQGNVETPGPTIAEIMRPPVINAEQNCAAAAPT
jgi:hypothetical protein